MSQTRMPTQARSIEKRKKIIEAGFNLICEKGYHNVTTNDIAAEAGVSVGIIYQYFEDKKDIFLEGIKNYSDGIVTPTLTIFDGLNINMDNFKSVLEKIINNYIKKHKIKKEAHEELLSESHNDPKIANIFKEKELETINGICEILKRNNIDSENLKEKVHIAYSMVEDLCHDTVYHKHKDLDYDVMKNEVINIIINLFKK